MHRLATTLAVLLSTAQQQMKLPLHPDDSGFEFDVHRVIEEVLSGSEWPDERKADLYALIVERVTADMKLADMERALNLCLHANERWATR